MGINISNAEAGQATTLDTELTAGASSHRPQALAEWLRALAEPNRLRIVDLLMQGEQCNCEMGGTLNMAPNLISHHLSVLQKAGLVEARRDESDARWIHYSIDQTALAALNRAFTVFFDPARIQPRQPSCAPSSALLRPEITLSGDR